MENFEELSSASKPVPIPFREEEKVYTPPVFEGDPKNPEDIEKHLAKSRIMEREFYGEYAYSPSEEKSGFLRHFSNDDFKKIYLTASPGNVSKETKEQPVEQASEVKKLKMRRSSSQEIFEMDM